jgi:hypothetical protein
MKNLIWLGLACCWNILTNAQPVITGINIPGATVTNSGKNWEVTFYSSTNSTTNKTNYKEIQLIQSKTKGEYLVFDDISGSSDWQIVQGNPGSSSWSTFCQSILENSSNCTGTCTTSYYIRNVGTSTGEFVSNIRIGLNTGSAASKSSCIYDTTTAFKIKITVKKVNSTGIYNWTEPASGTDSSYSISSNWTPARTSPSSSDILVFDLANNTTMRSTSVYMDGIDESVSQIRVAPYNNVTFKCSTSSNSGRVKIGESTSATGTDFLVDTLAGFRVDGGTITTRVESGNTSLLKSNITMKSGTWLFDGAGTHVTHGDIVLRGGTLKFQPVSGTNTLNLRGKNTKLTGSGTLYIDSNMNVVVGNGASSTYTLEASLPIYSKLTLAANTTLASNTPTNGYATASDVNGFTPYLQLKATAKANSTAFGQLLAVPASSSITGGALFEIFNNKQRSYRTIGLPFSTAMIIPQFTDDIDVTGTYSGSNANEFTTSCTTCNSSMFNWVESSSSWSAYTSTSSVTSISQGTGILVFFRGARGNGLGDTTITATSQTLDFKGVLSQGSYSFTLSNSGSGTYKGYNLVSNPYPCTIDLKSVYESNRSTILPRFYLYDAIARRYNGWDSVGKSGSAPSTSGTSRYTTSSNRNRTKLLAPGAAAFFVVDNSGSSTTLTFAESHKYTGALSVTNHFSSGVQEELPMGCSQLTGEVHFQNRNLPESDGFTIEFDQIGQSDLADIQDMPKLHAYFGFGTTTENDGWLTIDRRGSMSVQEGSKVVPLKIAYPKQDRLDLELAFNFCEITNTIPYNIYLVDKVKREIVTLENGTYYPYTCSSTEEKKSDRFELVFVGDKLNNRILTQTAYAVFPNPVENTLSILDPNNEIKKIELINGLGSNIKVMQLNGKDQIHSIQMDGLPMGIYQLRLISTNGSSVQTILKK